MSRAVRMVRLLLAGMLIGSLLAFGQAGIRSVTPSVAVWNRPALGGFGGYGGFGRYGGFGGYGGFSPWFNGYPGYAPPQTYYPNYWWVSPYPIGDPRQDGYNPSAGYEWDSVGTLILTTYPANARVKLDGVYVGTADRLGPFQLPVGEHTLRVEAPSYETSETIVRFEEPGIQELEVQLHPLSATAKPGPRP